MAELLLTKYWVAENPFRGHTRKRDKEIGASRSEGLMRL